LGGSTKPLLGRNSLLATIKIYPNICNVASSDYYFVHLSMLLDKSNKASFEFPESLTQKLGPGRVEPPEDVGKGGTLWHGRAGSDDDLTRA
jgi:hypothetical protein